ncbi:class I SAM-dependent methyltransferase [Pseudoflavitalea sp. G-6-1-2]|uniref:class I SAM-dependent methyltransferase n=1 Tax=Pseudoflavitalea sp. G-6-1-2 TaxID=2728841 RepID=UPI00146C83BD|nr:class I SAM-dependent methyltransferase [Pseudoflavitalea sp. G-6-1-2]NML23598.1 class I SAM-dependent methyltransferase [Pseudoflavitalea sp. G-6-1-2]
MIAILKTAERADSHTYANNYIYQRHVFAYKAIPSSSLHGKTVLEVGCGEGYGMEMLHHQAAQWLAIDKKKPARVEFNDHKQFQYCLLPHLTGIPSNNFDTVICFQVIEHIEDDHALLREMKRVLKPGGTLYLTTPNKMMSLTRNPFHVREYAPVSMQVLIAKHFHRASVEGIYGNDIVMDYYEANKKNVQRILKFDVLDLQHNLPAALLRGVYSLMNNYNRLQLARKSPDITAGILHTDFQLKPLDSGCLDYFVTARKHPEEA